jgi:hypothetical protein
MKSYTKKNGEVILYDQTEYNKKFYEKNKDKINDEKIICQYCNKEYVKRNKYNHEKSLKHKLYKELNKKEIL